MEKTNEERRIMAMSIDKKLYVAAGILAIMGAALWAQNRSKAREEAGYTLQPADAKLPSLSLTEDQTKKIDRIVIEQPAGDAGKAPKVVLEKKDDTWNLVEPVAALANKSNVESLLRNFQSIGLTERISDKEATYAQYEVSNDKAVHVVAYEKGKALVDLYAGQGGSRGQMLRIAGKTGVFSSKGYSSYLVSRELKAWRDLSLMKYDDKQVKAVRIENEYGTFDFTKLAKGKEKAKEADKQDKKDAGNWEVRFKKAKGGVVPVPRFHPSKVDDLVRAFKALNAIDFGRDKSLAEVGLDAPSASITFEMEDGARKSLHLGKPGESNDRWVRAGESTEVFTITKYTSEWVTSDMSKYQKPEDKKDKEKDATPTPTPPPELDLDE